MVACLLYLLWHSKPKDFKKKDNECAIVITKEINKVVFCQDKDSNKGALACVGGGGGVEVAYLVVARSYWVMWRHAFVNSLIYNILNLHMIG